MVTINKHSIIIYVKLSVAWPIMCPLLYKWSINFSKRSMASIHFDLLYSISRCAFHSFHFSFTLVKTIIDDMPQSLLWIERWSMIMKCATLFDRRLQINYALIIIFDVCFGFFRFFCLRHPIEPILMGSCHFIIINLFFLFFFCLWITWTTHATFTIKQLKRFILFSSNDRKKQQRKKNEQQKFAD